jgi:hypothetical protein
MSTSWLNRILSFLFLVFYVGHSTEYYWYDLASKYNINRLALTFEHYTILENFMWFFGSLSSLLFFLNQKQSNSVFDQWETQELRDRFVDITFENRLRLTVASVGTALVLCCAVFVGDVSVIALTFLRTAVLSKLHEAGRKAYNSRVDQILKGATKTNWGEQ